jgi:hypothetical protein
LILLLAALACAASGALAFQASAALIAYEPFDYEDGESLAGQDGGFGFGGSWPLVAGTGSADEYSIGPGLSKTGVPSTGNAAVISSLGSFFFPVRPLAEQLGRGGARPVWVSFLIQREGVVGSGGGIGFDGSSGPFFGVGDTGAPIGPAYGLAVTGSGAVGGYDTAPSVVGETDLVVVHLVFSDVTPSFTAELFVNPALDAPPTGTPAASGGYSGTTLDRLGLVAGPTGEYRIDEIRVATSFEDAVSGVPEPAASLLLVVGLVGLGRCGRPHGRGTE